MDIKIGLVSYGNITSLSITPIAKSFVYINEKKIENSFVIYSYKDKIKLDENNKISFLKEVKLKINGTVKITSKKKERYYKGTIEVKNLKGFLFMVNTVDLEDYVLSVTDSETRHMRNLEAIKANAVSIRSYAIAAGNRHEKQGYNFCDLTHCQLYKGFKDIRENTYKAVRETSGVIMEFDKKPIWAMYHSVCGGETENAKDVWNYDTMPYLVSVKDDVGFKTLCSEGWGYRWRTKIRIKRFERFLQKSVFKNKSEKFVEISNIVYTDSGRVKSFDIISDKRKITISGINFYHIIGRELGWMAIKSTAFTVSRDNKYIIFEGKGYGHGVGMCQAGADKMGELGYGYRDILNHYYKNTKMVKYSYGNY